MKRDPQGKARSDTNNNFNQTNKETTKLASPLHLKNKKKSNFVTVFFRWMRILFLPIVLGVVSYYVHRNFFYLPSLVRTASDLPRVLNDNHFFNLTDDGSNSMFWGTYRSPCYFGMKTRSPISPLIGLVWYTQPSMNVIMPSVRHWCSQSDGLNRYGWLEHDGKTFGVQEILDDDLLIKTSFVKRLGGKHGGDFTIRIEADTLNPEENATAYSFIIYVALDSSSTAGHLRPILKGKNHDIHLSRIDGSHPELGNFVVRFAKPTNLLARNFLASESVDTALFKEAIITGTGFHEFGEDSPNLLMSLMGYVPKDKPPTDNPRFLAAQFTVVGSTTFDVIFESSSFKDRPNTMTDAVFDVEIEKRRSAFNNQFEEKFRLKEKMQADVYVEVGKHALSNMLGSAGYFYGFTKVRSQFTPASQPFVLYGPHQLFCTVPSRSFFPRGFLWDEGFQQLLVSKWSLEMTKETLGSWLDLMNIDGWIPREIILGSESEARVPAEFIIQKNNVANPPMFTYLARTLLDRRHENPEMVDNALRAFYPRLKARFYWLNSSQAGSLVGTYRWRGRNSTTDLELNPKTFASGFDDYPRASHPTTAEYHVDLYSWMAMAAKTMLRLAEFFDDKEALPAFRYTSTLLNDENLLNSLHWSEKQGQYCDYGSHTKNVELKRVITSVNAPDSAGSSVPLAMLKRVTSSNPKLRLVSDTFGYVSLFPMFLRILAHDSPKLGIILNKLRDESLLWTPFGLRSLAKTAPLYGKHNTELDAPYWRGAIWINMNYLALSSLHYYSSVEGPHRQLAFDIYASLRINVITNVVKEYKRTGYLWEHYDDITGKGEGVYPFTGWTSLIVLIMGEQYH